MLRTQSKVTTVQWHCKLSKQNTSITVLSVCLVAGKKGNIEGMVRVTNPVTGQRALILGKSSEVLHLQFAHIKSQIMLASIENTALHIHKIETVNDSIICTLLLKIDDPIDDHVPKFDKINWCPYVPENETETDSDAGKLLVWTRGTSFQCYNVGAVVDSYGVSFLDELVSGSSTIKYYQIFFRGFFFCD